MLNLLGKRLPVRRFLALVLLVGVLAPGARAQKITAVANASWTYSGYLVFGSSGTEEDNLNVSMYEQVVEQPDTNGNWIVVSTNYNISVTGNGSDPFGDSWTWVGNPTDSINDGAGVQLEFDDSNPTHPFDFGWVTLYLFPPEVETDPPNAGTLFSLPLVNFAQDTFTVATNGAVSVSGSETTNAIPETAEGLSVTGTGTVSYTVTYDPGSTKLAIVSVQTPAAVNGNQNTFISSDTITVKATVGNQGGIPVMWSVNGLNSAFPGVLLTNQMVNSDASGNSTFSFSPAQIGAFPQFRKSNFTKTGSRAPNQPVNFEVVAQAQGQTVTLSQSGVGTLQQDDIDTLRQEYVDYVTFKTSGPYTPQRSDVVPSLAGNYNGGNYGVQLAVHMDTSFAAILQAYQSATITVNGVTGPMPPAAQLLVKSGYRNPQRNKAIGSKFPQTSHHMFGGALDLKPVPSWVRINGKRVWVDMDQVLFPVLQQAAATQGTAISEIGSKQVDLGTPGENHIHVEW